VATMNIHSSHNDVLRRLKVAKGHLEKVIRMIEEGEPCLTVAQQLKAVHSGIERGKATYIRDHMEHCLDDASSNSSNRPEKLAEFKQISKFL